VAQRFENVDVAFVDRFEELHRVAYRAAYAVLGRRADAEDCAQEALARALVRWRSVQGYAPAWVARVSTNQAIDRARRSARTSASTGEERHADPMSDRRRDLVVALRALPKRQREAVALRYLADLPEVDAAAAMGCSLGTIKSATSRGLERLRTELGPQWAWED
jgi:RNA polymerase sigma factor (sigma-70 family)